MYHKKTAYYKDVLQNTHIFPAGDYPLEEIYVSIRKQPNFPEEHLESRPTVRYPKWKNYFHSVRPNIDRIEYLGNELYRFK